MVLYQEEIQEVLRLRSLTWIRDTDVARPFPHCANPVDVQEFINHGNNHDHQPPSQLCHQRLNDHIYILTMVMMRLPHQNT